MDPDNSVAPAAAPSRNAVGLPSFLFPPFPAGVVLTRRPGFGDDMTNERIQLTDTFQDIIVKLSDGNPGAIHVCMELAKTSSAVDPDSALGPLGPLLSLDTHGIYGSRIWMLYKDVCGERVIETQAALRAVQLGLVSEGALLAAIDGRCGEFNPDEALAAVKKRLPRFAAETADATA